MVAIALFVGIVIGVCLVIGLEVLGVLFLIKKLGEKTSVEKDGVNDEKKSGSGSDDAQFSFPNKQVSFFARLVIGMIVVACI